ncbi:MAG: tetratricopeptide repeat protein [Flavobacteriales bacterium]|nr:tetratricopeptide repeat protein [Flavobacteriales bacterium]
MQKIRLSLFCALIFGACLVSSCGNSDQDASSEDSEFATIEDLNKQIRSDPNNAALYHQRAKQQMDKGFYESAIKDLERAVKLDSTVADYHFTSGEAYFRVNQTRQSRDAFEKCVKLNPQHVEALLKLAELYLYVNGNKKSIEYLDQALQVDKHLAKAYMMKGLNFKEMGDTVKALSSFQTAVEQDPEYYDAYMQLGLLSAAQNDPLAVAYYDNALNVDPVSVEALYGKAIFFQNSGDVNKALEVYNIILGIKPDHISTQYNLGYIYAMNFKKYPLAVDFFRNAFKADSSYVKARYMLGYCQEMMGFDDLAAEDYTWVLQKDPDFDLATQGMRRLGF